MAEMPEAHQQIQYGDIDQQSERRMNRDRRATRAGPRARPAGQSRAPSRGCPVRTCRRSTAARCRAHTHCNARSTGARHSNARHCSSASAARIASRLIATPVSSQGLAPHASEQWRARSPGPSNATIARAAAASASIDEALRGTFDARSRARTCSGSGTGRPLERSIHTMRAAPSAQRSPPASNS